MTKYIKTGTTEFEQFNYEKWVYMRQDAYPMVFGDTAKDGGMMATNPLIKTLEGNMKIKDNDWIATGVNGEHWVVKDEIFQKTYKKLPVIPERVADYIESFSAGETDMDVINVSSAILGAVDCDQSNYIVADWIKEHGDEFARAWLDSYEVEE